MNASTQPGQSLGKAAGSLGKAKSWLGSTETAKVGAAGEKKTAAILDSLAARPGGPSVIHDLRIPIPGISANIDHLVVSGRSVTLIDSKVWKPAFYWTIAGRTFRGIERFAPADKKTLPMAYDAIVKHLAKHGITAVVKKPLLIVWSSNTRNPIALWCLRSPGARSVTGPVFALRARSLVGHRPANATLLIALAELTIGGPKKNSPLRTSFEPGEL